MKELSKYDIQFVNLKQGIHNYEFLVDNKFFAEFECDEFSESDFKIELELEKQSTMMVLNFIIDGYITVPCDRCLDDVDIDFDAEERLIVKFGQESYNETEEIVILSENEYKINVAQYIYEFIMIHIPHKRVHIENL